MLYRRSHERSSGWRHGRPRRITDCYVSRQPSMPKSPRSPDGLSRPMTMAGRGARWACWCAAKRPMFRRFDQRLSGSASLRVSTSRLLLQDAPAVRYFRAIDGIAAQRMGPRRDVDALRLPGSPLEAGSARRRVRVCRSQPRARQPAWTYYVHSATKQSQAVLNQLDSLTPWTTGKAFPRTWAVRLAQFCDRFFCPMDLHDRCSHELALLWRSHAAALDAFRISVRFGRIGLDAATPIECKHSGMPLRRCWPLRSCVCRTIAAMSCMLSMPSKPGSGACRSFSFAACSRRSFRSIKPKTRFFPIRSACICNLRAFNCGPACNGRLTSGFSSTWRCPARTEASCSAIRS